MAISQRLVSTVSLGALLGVALAAWPTDPDVNVPLCAVVESQIRPAATSDDAGGFIVTWQDSRSGSADIRAQRASADGVPRWTADGVVVCDEASQQWEPAVVGDGAGGAIVLWEDRRVVGSDIYAQRVDASGARLWANDGVVAFAANDSQEDVRAVSDGAGGAVFVWVDERSPAGSDILAQRIDAGGNRVWAAEGVACCAALGDQYDAEIVTDGQGGAIVVWQDDRAAEIYLQRILANGTLDWTTDGIPVASSSGYASEHAVTSDGSGGVIVTWTDDRLGSRDIYAQRFDGTGGGGTTPVCTIGSAVVLQGNGFGTTKKPKAYVLYEKKPGKQKKAPLKVVAWTDTTIDATWKKKVPLATYSVWVQPKGGQPAPFGEVAVVAPALDAGQNLAGAPKARLTLSGMHFGTKQGKVLVEYVSSKGKTKRKRCRVSKKTWVMDPVTGASSVEFLVPRLPAATYDLILAGKLGEATTPLTIN